LERLDRKIAQETYELSMTNDIMLKAIIDEMHHINVQQHTLIDYLAKSGDVNPNTSYDVPSNRE
jgi:hypothetical protein